MLTLEKKHESLLPLHHFMLRFAWFLAGGGLLVLAGLLIGIAGYHWICGLPWVDSLLNASMILGGMGPVDVLQTNASKIFASAYAIFSGLVFMTVMGVVMAPIVHRVLHVFHIEGVDEKSDDA